MVCLTNLQVTAVSPQVNTVDPTKTCTQANDTAAKGLLSNLRQRYHETC